MNSLNESIYEYTAQLKKGSIQKAYKGIMTFMSDLKSNLENRYPSYISSALYFGYMDMTYFAFTPQELKEMKLKIAVVYLHEENRFEIWFAANNRSIQSYYIKLLSGKNIGAYSLSQLAPGVDSIIEYIAVVKPDFNNQKELKEQLEEKTIKFAEEIISILK